jgi:quinol monooxygenase YgiN
MKHMKKFGLIGKITTQEGQRDALVQILLEAADLMQSVEGCELYVVSISDDEPETVWVNEVWSDAEAHAASLKRDEVLALIQRGMPLIAGFGERITLRPVGGKGF